MGRITGRLSDGSGATTAWFVGGVALWLALMVVWGWLDLDVSRAIVDPGAPEARFGARAGEIPGLLVGVVGLFFAAFDVAGASVARRVAAALVGALAVLGAGYLVANVAADGATRGAFLREHALVVVVACALGLAAAWFMLARAGVTLSLRHRRAVWGAALTGVLLIAAVLALKALWGRVRFRDLDVTMQAFTPWIVPQGGTGHHSFPSGHTALGWMLLPLLAYLPSLGRRWRGALLVLVVAWGLFVAYSRVRGGAHYASDVTFSTGLAVALWLVVDRRVRRRVGQE